MLAATLGLDWCFILFFQSAFYFVFLLLIFSNTKAPSTQAIWRRFISRINAICNVIIFYKQNYSVCKYNELWRSNHSQIVWLWCVSILSIHQHMIWTLNAMGLLCVCARTSVMSQRKIDTKKSIFTEWKQSTADNEEKSYNFFEPISPTIQQPIYSFITMLSIAIATIVEFCLINTFQVIFCRSCVSHTWSYQFIIHQSPYH